MDRQKLIHQLFIGKVADFLGVKKQQNCLKRQKKHLLYPMLPHVLMLIKKYLKNTGLAQELLDTKATLVLTIGLQNGIMVTGLVNMDLT